MTNFPPAPPSPYYAPAPLAPKSDGLAIAGMVVGICSLFLGWLWTIPAIVGIVLSGVALNRISKSNGVRGGKGLAIAGLVCSIVALAFWGLIFLAVLGSSS